MIVNVPISVGELIDKITILKIKKEKIANKKKLKNIKKELQFLEQVVNELQLPDISDLETQLTEVNRVLWEVEDDIRIKEKNLEFDARFIALARNVYKTNDQRSKIKYDINLLVGSELVEEKSYE
jgi:hypothetical protein